ncbi:MAG: ester cyclase [Chloroflexi bacterium]|nr:ester cyclase [Chloroflexota bacterium]
MSLKSNKIIACRSIEEVWNQHDPDAVDKLYADNYIGHGDLPGATPDRKGYKKWVANTIRAFPDLEFSIRDQIAEGDEVAGLFSSARQQDSGRRYTQDKRR